MCVPVSISKSVVQLQRAVRCRCGQVDTTLAAAAASKPSRGAAECGGSERRGQSAQTHTPRVRTGEADTLHTLQHTSLSLTSLGILGTDSAGLLVSAWSAAPPL